MAASWECDTVLLWSERVFATDNDGRLEAEWSDRYAIKDIFAIGTGLNVSKSDPKKLINLITEIGSIANIMKTLMVSRVQCGTMARTVATVHHMGQHRINCATGALLNLEKVIFIGRQTVRISENLFMVKMR